ncbi:hypothetical protein PGT21_010624 [Puccinia graminis f. sp. tritici]|uniref:Uncharacterized protein n=1 Tax=Puccinia graminis f. sp. tritici TaxID=56615 RepID=A0A5B0LRC8_PUCGR|nr:hypothetical protein PGTUg99_023355 [Puccinia graminis f. sp. tritici]KAA1083889.1 hypothetical protein PGT21_010624 [Puccinia graminis f. sp. tritici]
MHSDHPYLASQTDRLAVSGLTDTGAASYIGSHSPPGFQRIHSDQPSQTNKMAVEKAKNHRGSQSPPDFQPLVHPSAFNEGLAPHFMHHWSYDSQPSFVPDPHGHPGFIPGYEDARNEMQLNPGNTDYYYNYANVGVEYPGFSDYEEHQNPGNIELYHHRNWEHSGFHSFDNSWPASPGISYDNLNARMGNTEHLAIQRWNQNAAGRNYGRNRNYSGFQNPNSGTSIRKNGRFPSNDYRKNGKAKASKAASYNKVPMLNQEHVKTANSIEYGRASKEPPKTTSSDGGYSSSSQETGNQDTDFSSGNPPILPNPGKNYGPKNGQGWNTLLPEKPQTSSVSPPQVGRSHVKPTLANFLAANTRSEKGNIHKPNQEIDEQLFKKGLELKYEDGSIRKNTMTELPLLAENGETDIKRFIQKFHEESETKRGSLQDNNTDKKSETKRGKAKSPVLEEDSIPEDIRLKREKKKKWEASLTRFDRFEKMKRRPGKVEFPVEGHFPQDMARNPNVPIEENITVEAPSADESTKLEAGSLKGGTSSVNASKQGVTLLSKDTVDPSMQGTGENSKKTLQDQEMAGGLETKIINHDGSEALPGSNKEIHTESASNQAQTSKDLLHLATSSSRPRNLAKKKGDQTEEENILRLIEYRKNHIEPNKPPPRRPLYFKKNYVLDEKSLEESFEEYKLSLKSENPRTKSPTSLMVPLKIDERILPKKLALVFDALNHKIKHDAVQAIKPLRLNQFSKSTVKAFCELWGEQTVLEWNEQNLDISLMARLALELNLDNKTPHFGISPSSQLIELYERFRANFLNSKFKFHQVESSFTKVLGKAESNRRFIAFFRCLQDETSTRNWIFVKKKLMNENIMKESDAACFEKRLGLSTDSVSTINLPSEPGFLNMKGPFAHSTKFIAETMACVYGQFEGKRKLELNNYLQNRLYRPRWWESLGLEEDSKKYGLDLFSILKVGDSLQFGSNYFLRGAKATVAIDMAFRVIINVMHRDDTHLPWMESPERAWLHKASGGLYQDRLRVLNGLSPMLLTEQPKPTLFS